MKLVQIPAPPLTVVYVLGKLFNLTETLFLKMRNLSNILLQKAILKTKWNNGFI